LIILRILVLASASWRSSSACPGSFVIAISSRSFSYKRMRVLSDKHAELHPTDGYTFAGPMLSKAERDAHRGEVVSKIWAHIKQHELQDPKPDL
jgi:hypothetical protein